MKKEIKIFRDNEAIRASLQETRSKILSLLKLNDLTINQIAESLGKERSNIYRHVKRLERYGYIEATDEIKKGGAYEKVYSRTAKFFIMTPKSIDSDKPTTVGEWDIGQTRQVLKQLKSLGFGNECSEELAKSISKFFLDIGNDFTDCIQDNIEEMEEMNILEFIRLEAMYLLLEMEEDEELKKRIEKIRSQFEKKD